MLTLSALWLRAPGPDCPPTKTMHRYTQDNDAAHAHAHANSRARTHTHIKEFVKSRNPCKGGGNGRRAQGKMAGPSEALYTQEHRSRTANEVYEKKAHNTPKFAVL